MLRFRCPACNKTLKAPESRAGKKVSCPRCHTPALVPAPEPEPPASAPDDPPVASPSLSTGLRLAVAGLAAVAGLGLLAFVVGPFLGMAAWVANVGLGGGGVALAGLLAILYGHATGCPECGAWWSRCQMRSEVAEREVFERDGATYGRSVTRSEFRCAACGHAWSVSDAEEYPVSEREAARGLRE